MIRRKALIVLGTLLAGLTGKWVKADGGEEDPSPNSLLWKQEDNSWLKKYQIEPQDVVIADNAFKNIIIKTSTGNIIISWNEIITALKEIK